MPDLTLYDMGALSEARIHHDQLLACELCMLQDDAVAMVDWSAGGDPSSPDDVSHPIARTPFPARGVE